MVDNDIEMIDMCHGVAMENGLQELRRSEQYYI